MINTTTPDPLERATITASAHQGFTITTTDGRPAQLAIIADDQVIESGDAVARVLWQIASAAMANFLRGQGYITVSSGPVAAVGEKRKRA